MAQSPIQGEYYFRRQEMVAGFNFFTGGRFEFFYSYGAADRHATGTFTVEGAVLKLKSDKEGGQDFSIDEQSKNEGRGYVVKCQSPNTFLLPYMQCIAFTGDKPEIFEAGNDGVIFIDMPHCDKIYVINNIFPDIPTLIKDENNENNLFIVSILASVQEVSFRGIEFKIEDENSISCLANYFMPLEGIEFTKN